MPMTLRRRGEPKDKTNGNVPPTTTTKQTKDRKKKQGTTSKSSASSSSLRSSASSQESQSILKPHYKAIHDALAAALHVPGADEWQSSGELLLNKVRAYAAEAEQRRGQPLEQLLPKTPMGKMISASRRPAIDPVMEDAMRAIPEVDVDNAGPTSSMEDSTASTIDPKPKGKRKKAIQKISIPASPYHTRQRVAKLRRASAASSTATDTGRSSADGQTKEKKIKTKTAKKKVQENKKQETKATKATRGDAKKRKIDEEHVQPQTITSVPLDFNFNEYEKVSAASKKRRMDGSEGAGGPSGRQEENETSAASESQVAATDDSVSALARDVDRKLKIKPTVRVTRLPSLIFREKQVKEPIATAPADIQLAESKRNTNDTNESAEEFNMDIDSPKTPRRSNSRLNSDSKSLKLVDSFQNAVATVTGSWTNTNSDPAGDTSGNELALMTEDEDDNTIQDEEKESFKTATGRSSGNLFEDSFETTATPEPGARNSNAINASMSIKLLNQSKSSGNSAVGEKTFVVQPVCPQGKSGEETSISQNVPLRNKRDTASAEEQHGTSTLPNHVLNGTFVVPNLKPGASSLADKLIKTSLNATYAVDKSPGMNTFPRSSNNRNKSDFRATCIQPKTPSLIPRVRSGAFSSPTGSPSSIKQPALTKYKSSKQPSTSSSSTVTNDTDGSSDTNSRPTSSASQCSVKENMQKKPKPIGLVQKEKNRIETQEDQTRMKQLKKFQEKQEAAEKIREKWMQEKTKYPKTKNQVWEKMMKSKDPAHVQLEKKATTGYVHDMVVKLGNSGFTKPHPPYLPKHLNPIAGASSCPDINKNPSAGVGKPLTQGVSAGNLWNGLSSTIRNAISFAKPQVPIKQVGGTATSSRVLEQEKKVNTEPDSSMDETFTTCNSDVNVSSYDITVLEEYDENLAHRENKHIPRWASDGEKLKKCLFIQQPKFMSLIDTEVFPPHKRGYRIFPRRREIVEEDE